MPETIEASLQLSEAVLVDIGVPMGLVIASVHEKREESQDPARRRRAGTVPLDAEARARVSRSGSQRRSRDEIFRPFARERL